VRAAPDRAFVTITTEARAREPEAAQQQSATAMASVQAKVKALDVPTDGIRTVHYDLQPQYDYIEGRQTLRGYVATNAIAVRIDDLSRVGAIVDAAVHAGATSVAGVRFALKERDEVEREALKQAVADARAKVDAAASAAGVTVERIWSVTEGRVWRAPPVPMMRVRAEAAEDVRRRLLAYRFRCFPSTRHTTTRLIPATSTIPTTSPRLFMSNDKMTPPRELWRSTSVPVRGSQTSASLARARRTDPRRSPLAQRSETAPVSALLCGSRRRRPARARHVASRRWCRDC
jgi:uncharacterized protein YggE